MTKPLGHYVSVRANHPAAPILKELETRFGSRFEKLSEDELFALIVGIAAECDAENHWSVRLYSHSKHLEDAVGLTDRLAEIDIKLASALIPFLHAQLEGRR